MNRKAFTLIELLVVVAIIGILAAVGVVAYNGYTGAAKKAVVKSNLKMVSRSIQAELYRCLIGDKLSGWSFGMGNPPNSVVDVNCNTSQPDAFERFRQDFGQTFARFTEDTNNFPNPFDSNDPQGGFTGDHDPPLPEHVGRVTCGNDASQNRGFCYGRWGTGTNEYDTVYINNPYE